MRERSSYYCKRPWHTESQQSMLRTAVAAKPWQLVAGRSSADSGTSSRGTATETGGGSTGGVCIQVEIIRRSVRSGSNTTTATVGPASSLRGIPDAVPRHLHQPHPGVGAVSFAAALQASLKHIIAR
jgi:hypothetical protein